MNHQGQPQHQSQWLYDQPSSVTGGARTTIRSNRSVSSSSDPFNFQQDQQPQRQYRPREEPPPQQQSRARPPPHAQRNDRSSVEIGNDISPLDETMQSAAMQNRVMQNRDRQQLPPKNPPPPRRNTTASEVTTPSSNADKRQTQQQHQQRRGNSPPPSPLNPLNLSHISPQDSVSLLTTPGRGDQPTTASRDTSRFSYSTASIQPHDGKRPIQSRPPPIQENSRRISNNSSGSNNPAFRQQLTQLVSTLQTSLATSQARLDQQDTSLGEKDARIQQIESDHYHLQQNFQKLQLEVQEEKRTAQRLQQQADANAQLKESLEADVQQLQSQLEQKSNRSAQDFERKEQQTQKQAQALQRERQQIKELQQQWLTVQKTQMEDLENQYQQQQEEMEEQQARIVEERHTIQDQRVRMEAQHQVLLGREEELTKKHRQMTGWEERLGQKQQALEERTKEVTQQEGVTRRRVQELKHLEAMLQKESKDLENKRQSYEAQHMLMEQALEELVTRRKDEENQLELATQNLEEMQSQARKIKSDTKTVKEALKAKMATSHAEYSRLMTELENKQREFETLKERLKVFMEGDRKSRQLADDRSKQEMQELANLKEKMEEVRIEMLIDEEAIVEQRKEHEELLTFVKDDEIAWERAKQERVSQEEEEAVSRRATVEAMCQEQIKKAKEELMSLGRFMTSQNEVMSAEYERRVEQLDTMSENMAVATNKFRMDKERLERDIAEYGSRRKQLDQLVNRLDTSEQQYKDRQEELEFEVERLKALIEKEQRSHEEEMKIEMKKQQGGSEELRAKHKEELQELASRIGNLEAERKSAESAYNTLKEEKTRIRMLSAKEMESLQRVKDSLEAELARALQRTDTAKSELENLKLDLDDREVTDTVEREKMQTMMSRLEANGEALARKQLKLDNQDRVIKEASADIEERLKELIEQVCILLVVDCNEGVSLISTVTFHPYPGTRPFTAKTRVGRRSSEVTGRLGMGTCSTDGYFGA
jgi:chromosome segregation ATPase